MRVIKFRAWDRERNEMLPITSMDWNTWWVSCEPILDRETKPLEYGERNSFQNERTDRHILMQYTGLKDKNGKDIYEGDIVQNHNGYNPDELILCRWQDAKDDGRWTVEKPGFSFERINGAGTTIWVANKHFEVIGNIYENADLLDFAQSAIEPTESHNEMEAEG